MDSIQFRHWSKQEENTQTSQWTWHQGIPEKPVGSPQLSALPGKHCLFPAALQAPADGERIHSYSNFQILPQESTQHWDQKDNKPEWKIPTHGPVIAVPNGSPCPNHLRELTLNTCFIFPSLSACLRQLPHQVVTTLVFIIKLQQRNFQKVILGLYSDPFSDSSNLSSLLQNPSF